MVTFAAAIASGAHQQGEEAEYFVYCVARALDVRGEGRISKMELARELRQVYRGGHLGRLFARPAGARYWSENGDSLVLVSVARIVESFACELARTPFVAMFSLQFLDTRPRRNAALFATVLQGEGGRPRSRAFIARFTNVDRKTWSAWQKDPVIRAEIFTRRREWVLVG